MAVGTDQLELVPLGRRPQVRATLGTATGERHRLDLGVPIREPRRQAGEQPEPERREPVALLGVDDEGAEELVQMVVEPTRVPDRVGWNRLPVFADPVSAKYGKD